MALYVDNYSVSVINNGHNRNAVVRRNNPYITVIKHSYGTPAQTHASWRMDVIRMKFNIGQVIPCEKCEWSFKKKKYNNMIL